VTKYTGNYRYKLANKLSRPSRQWDKYYFCLFIIYYACVAQYYTMQHSLKNSMKCRIETDWKLSSICCTVQMMQKYLTLPNPMWLKYAACRVIIVIRIILLFRIIKVSQRSVATNLRCDEIFNGRFDTHSIPQVKNFENRSIYM